MKLSTLSDARLPDGQASHRGIRVRLHSLGEWRKATLRGNPVPSMGGEVFKRINYALFDLGKDLIWKSPWK
ncbi:MAG: hypothetical protein A3G91_03590 [Omnitrophica WOR_2 bacterium RIFCSPLOWO2_12_FULL_50_9]|nr:MAG: hypothetical protein A3D87_06690 [Omnitrophica WOR_2 bacterium RIFCSPHIGHO2_02_FULL_50_17]OGX43203.1 MAG: hypothetical protein A3G91_03590 [Omnitrophica WOR_2 bacterium RIFCSPLOWO2_12_FULL_50_9]